MILRYFLVMDLVSFEACGGYRSFNVPSVFRLSCRIHFASFVFTSIGSCGHLLVGVLRRVCLITSVSLIDIPSGLYLGQFRTT